MSKKVRLTLFRAASSPLGRRNPAPAAKPAAAKEVQEQPLWEQPLSRERAMAWLRQFEEDQGLVPKSIDPADPTALETAIRERLGLPPRGEADALTRALSAGRTEPSGQPTPATNVHVPSPAADQLASAIRAKRAQEK